MEHLVRIDTCYREASAIQAQESSAISVKASNQASTEKPMTAMIYLHPTIHAQRLELSFCARQSWWTRSQKACSYESPQFPTPQNPTTWSTACACAPSLREPPYGQVHLGRLPVHARVRRTISSSKMAESGPMDAMMFWRIPRHLWSDQSWRTVRR